MSTARSDNLAAAFGDLILIYWWMGINQNVQGTATAQALIDLHLVTENLGSGSGPFSLIGLLNRAVQESQPAGSTLLTVKQ